MDMVRTFCCCDTKNTRFWKAAGIAIGWISLLASTWLIYEVLLEPASQSTIVSIIYIILVIFLNVNQHICKYVTIFLCVINWLTCAMWLCGITRNVKECLLWCLLWWGVEVGFFLVSFCIIILFFGLYETLFTFSTWEWEHICLTISTVLFVSFYIIALICFKSIKNATEYNSIGSSLMMTASYTPTSEEPEDDNESQDEEIKDV
ncbi:uncharacterized protein LOC116349006 [Contarinia nasturtii]|uniref:uncharacterized protein LOC116349006 n=1 Tax=Contarinia nasturtii TaxID=265458 RepID=UPI0012D44877|nr:uncharacterized protein LOC116349006 [Contarinia nasturtii]